MNRVIMTGAEWFDLANAPAMNDETDTATDANRIKRILARSGDPEDRLTLEVSDLTQAAIEGLIHELELSPEFL